MIESTRKDRNIYFANSQFPEFNGMSRMEVVKEIFAMRHKYRKVSALYLCLAVASIFIWVSVLGLFGITQYVLYLGLAVSVLVWVAGYLVILNKVERPLVRKIREDA